MDIENAVMKYKEDLINDLRRLVAIQSTLDTPREGMPAGKGTSDALAFMLERAQQMGFETRNVDGYMGYASYGVGTDYIAVIGHLDVVPEGEGWKHSPFGGEIENGKMYGRGTTDNKGASIAALYCLKVLKDLGCTGTKEVRAMFGTMEESGMDDMVYYLSRNPEPVMALVPDAGYPIYNKQRGAYSFILECPIEDNIILSANGGEKPNKVPEKAFAIMDASAVDFLKLQELAGNMGGEKSSVTLEQSGNRISVTAKGAAGSAGYAHLACNANNLLLDFLVKAFGERADRPIAFMQDSFKLETDGRSLGLKYDGEDFGIVSVSIYKLEIADGIARFSVDIRFPANQQLEEIRSIIAQRFHGFKITPVREYESHYVPEDGDLCTILSSVYEEATNDKTTYLCNYGMNYSRFMKNAVAYGNVFKWDDPSPAHGPDEFIPIDSLMEHCIVHIKALIRMMK